MVADKNRRSYKYASKSLLTNVLQESDQETRPASSRQASYVGRPNTHRYRRREARHGVCG